MERGGDMVVGGIAETGENMVEGEDNTEEAALDTAGFYKCAKNMFHTSNLGID